MHFFLQRIKYSFLRRLIVVICVFSIVFPAIFCNPSSTVHKEDKQLSPYLNINDSVHYVGINSCKECHKEIYNTFVETGMGKSFDIATHKKSAGLFNKHSLVYDKVSDFYYKPYWERDTLRVMEFRLEGKDTIHKRIETIHYIIGSGQHTNSHLVDVNGYLTQAPLTFYTQKGKWDLPPGFEKGFNSRFSRMIGQECMSCHNGYPKMVQGSENKYASIPKGIDCERCHGAGSLHVQEKKKGHLVDIRKDIDYTIVNPAKLSIELQFEVCQRCHLQGNAVLKEGKSFYDFKPGMNLSDVMDVYMPKYSGNKNEYIMASHVERLKMSECFIKTMEKLDAGTLPVKDPSRPYKDAITCVTCHNPHVSYKITGNETFNTVCKNCHNPDSKPECTEKKDTRLAVQDNCVKCHMPKNNTLDIPHVITTDHFIRKPIDKREINKIQNFIKLACINNPQPSMQSRANAFINHFEKFSSNTAFLDSAQKLLLDKSDKELAINFSILVHLYYAKKEYQKVISYINRMENKRLAINSDAWLYFRLGDSYFNVGDKNNAFLYIKKATELAPYNLEFQNKFGAILVEQNRLKEAQHVFEKIIKENPKFVPALSNLGYTVLILNQDIKTANTLYDKALALDPDYEQALLNKAGLLMYQKQFKKAEKYLKRILKKNPDNKQAKNILEQLK